MKRLCFIARGLCTAALVAGLGSAPAHAQTDQFASLRTALSLLSGGYTDLLGPALQLTRTDDKIDIHIDLPNLVMPRAAAITAVATPLPAGAWQIGDITFPPLATLSNQPLPRPGAAPITAAPITFGFSIAHQSSQARIDPTLVTPSTYQFDLGGVVLHGSAGRDGDRLTLAHIGLDGTFTGVGGGLMDRSSHATAADLRFAGHDSRGAPVAFAMGSIEARSDIHGFDPAQANRLRQALAAVVAHPPPPAPPPAIGQPRPLSPLARRQLNVIIDAGAGVFSSFSVEEVVRGFHVVVPQGDFDVARMRLGMGGNSVHDRVAAHIDYGLDGLSFSAVPPQFRALLPRSLTLRAAVSGLKAEAVRALLHEALAERSDPVLLQARAVALLNQRGARAEIESFSANVGPMEIHGSARVHALPDGTAELDIHLSATGTDALLQALQAEPATRRATPMLLMAKGLGRPEGNRTMWDIVLRHGEATVNGIALAPRPAPPAAPTMPMHR